MTETNFTNIIKKLNLTSDTWIRPSFIKEICLACDGNLPYNWLRKKLYFDTTEMNLKVKDSELKLASSIIEKYKAIDSTHIKIIPIIHNIISKGFLNMNLRPLRIGDYIYTVDKISKTILDAAVVTNIEYDSLGIMIVTLDSELEGMDQIVCYALGNKWETCFDYNQRSSVYKMYEINKTDYDFDQVIFLKHISGLSMR